MASSTIIKNRRNKIRRWNWFDSVLFIFTFLFAVLVLYPFYNSVLVSFTPQHVYVREPFMLFPREITLDSYRVVFDNVLIFSGFRVTLFVTVVGVLFNMLLTVTLAYCFTKNFPGKKFILYMIIFTLFFNGGLIPFFLLVRDLGLMNNIFSMILPTGVSILYMTVMRKYFEALPAELEDSAKIDGASEPRILWSIILPLSKPMLATFTLYYALDRWNEWWFGLLFIRRANLQPLQLVLRGIIQATGPTMTSDALEAAGIIPFSDGVRMASIVVTIIPIMCLYPYLQKYFVQGLTIGAVKG